MSHNEPALDGYVKSAAVTLCCGREARCVACSTTRSGDSSNLYPWQFGQVTTRMATMESQPSQTLKFVGAAMIF